MAKLTGSQKASERPPTEPVTMRIRSSLRPRLIIMAKYEGVSSVADLLRGWMTEKVVAYTNNSLYMQFEEKEMKANPTSE